MTVVGTPNSHLAPRPLHAKAIRWFLTLHLFFSSPHLLHNPKPSSLLDAIQDRTHIDFVSTRPKYNIHRKIVYTMSPSSFTEPFDEKDEKDSNWASRTNSTVPPERPQCMQRRNSLASLSYAQEDPIQHVGEPLWPQEWRAYVTLCGGFLLMFNSWGLVCQAIQMRRRQ